MFNDGFDTIFSIIFLSLFHFFLLLTIYAYLRAMFMNPGKPPKYWGFNDKPEQ